MRPNTQDPRFFFNLAPFTYGAVLLLLSQSVGPPRPSGCYPHPKSVDNFVNYPSVSFGTACRRRARCRPKVPAKVPTHPRAALVAATATAPRAVNRRSPGLLHARLAVPTLVIPLPLYCRVVEVNLSSSFQLGQRRRSGIPGPTRVRIPSTPRTFSLCFYSPVFRYGSADTTFILPACTPSSRAITLKRIIKRNNSSKLATHEPTSFLFFVSPHPSRVLF